MTKALNQIELEQNRNQVEPVLVDVSTTGFFLSTLSLAHETKEVLYGNED